MFVDKIENSLPLTKTILFLFLSFYLFFWKIEKEKLFVQQGYCPFSFSPSQKKKEEKKETDNIIGDSFSFFEIAINNLSLTN